MKFICINNDLTVVLDDGRIYNKKFDISEAHLLKEILEKQDLELVERVMNPNYQLKKELYEQTVNFIERVSQSKFVQREGNVLTIPHISKMSCPVDLVERILNAELEHNQEELDKLFNFWKLCTLNPSDVTRQNLFWFLKRNGMTITKDGLFVAYRNVIVKGKFFKNENLTKAIFNHYFHLKSTGENPKDYILYYDTSDDYYFVNDNKFIDEFHSENETLMNIGNVQSLYDEYTEYKSEKEVVFTDCHSQTTRIVIGKPVSIPREECDDNNEVTCSRGLHVASKDWLSENYCGDIGLICLVNPAKVVAVPVSDNYGKMRTCEYFPVAFSERDENGKLKDSLWLENAEKLFVEHISYEGTEGKDSNFEVTLHETPDVHQKSVEDLLNEFKNGKK